MLSIYISPQLKNRDKEIFWTLKTILTIYGIPWNEVNSDAEPSDIAYVSDTGRIINSKITILADLTLWDKIESEIPDDIVYCERYLQLSDGIDKYIHETPLSFRIEYDFIFIVFFVLSGLYEKISARNKYGQIIPDKSYFECEKNRLVPPLSKILYSFFETVSRVCKKDDERCSLWPEGKLFAACSTHDVDYPLVVRSLEPIRQISKRKISGIIPSINIITGKNHHWHFKEWIQLEKEMGIRSSFYFSAYNGSILGYLLKSPNPFYNIQLPIFKNLFKSLIAEDIEIGLHASFDAYRDEKKFLEEKNILEDAIGKTISGNRHHYWHLNPDNPDETFLIHEKIGLVYDCSLAYETHLGWRRGFIWPFFPFDRCHRRQINIIELPTSWMDNQIFGHSDLNNIRTDPDRILKLSELLNSAAFYNGILITDVHEYVFDENLFPEWRSTFIKFWELVCSHENVWIATPAEISQYWLNRASNIEQSSKGLGINQ